MLKPVQRAELEFQLGGEIGAQGRNSRVFRARDDQLNAELVIKQIEKTSLNSVDEYFSESQALYASTHPNAVQVQYACFDDDSIYIAMPLYASGSLTSKINGQYLTAREIITLGCQILSGLDNVHAKNLVHLDIKPDNVLLTQNGEAVLSDFGLAKQMNFQGIAAQNRLYNPMVPPEAYTTNQFDRTFEICQFGLLLYRMCNGNEDFYKQLAELDDGHDRDHQRFSFALRSGRFPDRQRIQPHVNTALRTVIRKCLETAPADRYKSAIEVSNALATIGGNILDWQLVAHPDRRTWTKRDGDRDYVLDVYDDNRSELKRSVGGEQARRIGKGCKERVTARDIQRLLGD